MKITGLRTLIFAPRPNYHNETPDYVVHAERQNGLAIIQTDEGLEGFISSEGAALRQFTRLWRAAAAHIEGRDPFDRRQLDWLLRRRFHWPQTMLGLLDYGLWDLAGKALGQPVYRLLGALRDQAPAYASTIHHACDEQFVETALRCQAQGFTAVKLHPYCRFEDDLRLIAKVRRAVGDDLRLMIDTLAYPAPYTRREARHLLAALDELNYYWFEDPLPRTDLEGLAELRRLRRVVQIRAADRAQWPEDYAALVQQQCVDIVAGPGSWGITDVVKLAAFAELHGLNMEPHDFYGGAASLHVVLAVPNAEYYEQAVPEGCFDSELYPGVYPEPLRVDRQGFVHPSPLPGLGLCIDLAAAESVTVERL